MSAKFAQEYNQKNDSKRQGVRIRKRFDIKSFIACFGNVFAGHDSHCKKEAHYFLIRNSITRWSCYERIHS